VASPVRSRVDLSIVGNGELRYFPAGLACEAVERPEDASGEYLLFLEPGAAPARGSIEELVRTADADPRIGAVGPRLVGPDGKLVEAGGIVFADGSLASYGAGDQPRDPRYRFVRDVDFVSPSCVVVRASAFPGLDGELDDPRYRFADLCLALRAAGHRVVCQPAAEATVDPHAEGPAPLTRARLERLRPIVLGPRPSDAEPHRVLVLGIAMADRQNTAEDVIASMESDRHEVVQRWIALGDEPDTPLLTAATAEIVRERVPKYELLNRLLAREPLGTYDHVVITDDDVVLPRRFLDSFLAFQDRFGFALAQPARTSTSYIDHPIVEQQLGTLARETRFVEIGPVLSAARAAYPLVFPFDLMSPMGWGYENVWAHRFADHGLKLGIVDAVPVDHSIRPPVANYGWHEADAQRRAFLAARPHVGLGECFRVIAVHPLEEAA